MERNPEGPGSPGAGQIRKGDIIRFKPEWSQAGEENLTFVAREDSDGGRFLYSALELSDWAIWPAHTARCDMVAAIVGRLNEDGSITRY